MHYSINEWPCQEKNAVTLLIAGVCYNKFRMKNIMRRLAAVAIMPAAITSSLFTTNISPTKGTEPKKLARPYIVNVIDAYGDHAIELKGTSSEIDPYLISQNLGAAPFPEDKFASFPSISMGIGSNITLYQAPVIKIKDGKRSKEVRSWQKTVGELFTEQKIEIGKDDKVNFANDIELEDNIQIVITRVAITTIVEKEAIKFTTTKKSNPNVEKGNKKTLQAGKNGTKDKYYLVRREDGEEVSRKLTKTEVSKEPTEEIVEVGTKVVVYGSGEASWYIRSSEMIGAYNTLPRGTRVHVVNMANGKSIDITTSGGGIRTAGRIVDLSTAAFQALGATLGQGTIANVRVEKYYPNN